MDYDVVLCIGLRETGCMQQICLNDVFDLCVEYIVATCCNNLTSGDAVPPCRFHMRDPLQTEV